MKIKLGIVALLCAFNINATAAQKAVNGNLDASYASDYFFRGASLGADALQFSVGANTKVGSVDLFADYFTNQTTGTNTANTDIVTVGAGVTFLDSLVDVYGGVINLDNDTAGSTLDGFVSAKINTLLAPSLTVYRNTDDSLYTVEGSLSHTVETSLVDLTVSVMGGTTDVTSSTDRSYLGGGIKLSRSFGACTPHVCLSVIDADDAVREEFVRAGVTFKF